MDDTGVVSGPCGRRIAGARPHHREVVRRFYGTRAWLAYDLSGQALRTFRIMLLKQLFLPSFARRLRLSRRSGYRCGSVGGAGEDEAGDEVRILGPYHRTAFAGTEIVANP